MGEGGRYATPVSGIADHELVARCRTGDDRAWAELVERFAPYVYSIAAQGFRLPQADAEDVFQDVFTRTYEHLDRLRDDAAIRPWIAQLTRRLAVDRLRSRSRAEPWAEVPEAFTGDGDVFARIDEALTVRDALVGLPDNCQEILDRFFGRDQSYRTISEALDVPPGTIASRISRCLVKLRDRLDESASTPS